MAATSAEIGMIEMQDEEKEKGKRTERWEVGRGRN